uniref:transposase n=1 Tax=Ichthyobacterium seriolicida TaxID=242600 RepID=UPI0012FDD56D|nr:transposase [Ichthyobacterium seriolicida]
MTRNQYTIPLRNNHLRPVLNDFTKTWESKYSYAVESWRDNLEELSAFYEFPVEIRKIIYTANLIENRY